MLDKQIINVFDYLPNDFRCPNCAINIRSYKEATKIICIYPYYLSFKCLICNNTRVALIPLTEFY